MYFDYYYLVLVVPTIILSLWAQYMVKSTFAKYSRVESQSRITGAAAAQYLMRYSGISDVQIRAVRGSLTDNYNPGNKTLNLSEPVYGRTSIAAVGVAAHETGHAIQHKGGCGPLVLRSTLVPIANIGSNAGPALAVLGLITGMQFLLQLGILLFAGAVLFYLVTLPVEFNASIRAVKILEQSGTLTRDELSGVKKVLTAAAMTYVASALTAIANLLRLILINNNRRRRY